MTTSPPPSCGLVPRVRAHAKQINHGPNHCILASGNVTLSNISVCVVFYLIVVTVRNNFNSGAQPIMNATLREAHSTPYIGSPAERPRPTQRQTSAVENRSIAAFSSVENLAVGIRK